MDSSMEVFLACALIIIVLWVIWRKKHLSVFKKLGIPGPEPNVLFGNILELYKKGPIKCHEEWVRKYGRVLGFFYGMKPVMLITDPEILKNIFIKDFQKFTDREPFNPIYHYNPHDTYRQSVLNMPGKKWKTIRSVLTPTFTTAKMKLMAGSIDSSIETMINIMKEKAKKSEMFDALDTYQRVTMDVITRTAFGVRTDVQENKKSRLLKTTSLLFDTNFTDPYLFVGLSFPALQWLCRTVRFYVLGILNHGEKPDTLLVKGVEKVLNYRRNNTQESKNDLLQLMIDSKIQTGTRDVGTEQLEAGNAEYEAKLDASDDTSKSYRKMADNEIISSSVTVLLAGYETTSTALTFTTYFLGKFPDVQEKLYNEIRQIVEDGQKLEYATVNKLPYMDKVLNESMRIYPPVYLFTNRYAVQDVQYGDLKIPKGTLVQAPAYFLHHDPELWVEPEKFDTERFNSKTNVNGISFFPFGVGPRNCLGMRFAQLEAKLVLAHVIYNFKVTVAEHQKNHLPVTERMRTLTPKKGVQVKLELRDSVDS